mmetsp:Transcript_18266/g.70586  ORF Transcript_18266/g.70586 Transcript_18266/m.70586 type:complete len:251 (-) Transcript_18266:477-1229(-)
MKWSSSEPASSNRGRKANKRKPESYLQALERNDTILPFVERSGHAVLRQNDWCHRVLPSVPSRLQRSVQFCKNVVDPRLPSQERVESTVHSHHRGYQCHYHDHQVGPLGPMELHQLGTVEEWKEQDGREEVSCRKVPGPLDELPEYVDLPQLCVDELHRTGILLLRQDSLQAKGPALLQPAGGCCLGLDRVQIRQLQILATVFVSWHSTCNSRGSFHGERVQILSDQDLLRRILLRLLTDAGPRAGFVEP